MQINDVVVGHVHADKTEIIPGAKILAEFKFVCAGTLPVDIFWIKSLSAEGARGKPIIVLLNKAGVYSGAWDEVFLCNAAGDPPEREKVHASYSG